MESIAGVNSNLQVATSQGVVDGMSKVINDDQMNESTSPTLCAHIVGQGYKQLIYVFMIRFDVLGC
eukprot:Gb_37601 [translate_table: standard]